MNVGGPPAASALHETHISYVFLVGDRALKLKKPVKFPFLDLSTRELRAAACHREVELNRRLAPDVYLGVADVLGPDGNPCDHLVLMRRMPDEASLASLVEHGAARREDLRAIARRLAAFHATAARSPGIDQAATRDALASRWEEGFREIQPFVGAPLDPQIESEVEQLARRYLAGRKELFAQRIADGRVVDGHGDLLAADVFVLPDGPRLLDCLEFDDRLRHGDVLADVGFLAMDLERLGAPSLAAVLLDAYREFGAETHPASLEHHYLAFRAHIRAKVACLRGGEADAEAAQLLEITRAHLRRARVTLTLVGGGPGAGKSTVAAALGAHFGWSLLRSDEVRKDLAETGHGVRAGGPLDEGIYAGAFTVKTYTELLRRARLLLDRGESVVIDATWHDADTRVAARQVAVAASADVIELRCDLALDVAVDRLVARARAGRDASDATPEVARAMAARADPWPQASVVDTSGSEQRSISAALDAAVSLLAAAW